MTLNDVQRAALVLFAARAAGPRASLEQMKAICYAVRNRVRQGWYDGQWLAVMEHAGEVAANPPVEAFYLDANNRALQRLIADVDDIYYGARRESGIKGAPTAQKFAPGTDDLEEAMGASCYWCFLDRPILPWFQKNIIDKPEEHACRHQMGMMMFCE